MSKAKQLMTANQVRELVSKLASEVIEKCSPIENFVLVGIRTRGVHLAQRIREVIQHSTGKLLPLAVLDITLYRDDLHKKSSQPTVKPTRLGFDIDGKHVLLVDDVLYTGRTARAALTELADFGRPSVIRYAVLIDRGHRELPIAPDFVAATLQTEPHVMIRLHLEEVDGVDEIILEQ